MVLFIRARLKTEKDTDMAFNSGPTVLDMKENGGTMLLAEEESSSISMEMSMMVRYFFTLIHIGDWSEDKANGFGVYTHADGSRYEGEWKDDK